MNKTLITTLALTTLLSGCGDSAKQTIVKQYFSAMQNKDVTTLKTILKNPKNAEMFSPDSGFSMTLNTFEVLEDVPEGVNVKYSRFCYADMILPTIVVDTDDGYKVDLMATMKGEFKAMKDSKPLKQYCYDFQEQPLTGILGGKPWSYVQSHTREINWGDKISQSTSLYAEQCDAEQYGSCSEPSLIISNLDLSGSGGNLNGRENITIHTPPNNNKVVSQGSYRVSQLENNQIKLELTFKHDNGDTINGHITLDKTN